MDCLRIITAVLVCDFAGFFGNVEQLDPGIRPITQAKSVGAALGPQRHRQEHLQRPRPTDQVRLDVQSWQRGILWKENLLSAGHYHSQPLKSNAPVGKIVVRDAALDHPKMIRREQRTRRSNIRLKTALHRLQMMWLQEQAFMPMHVHTSGQRPLRVLSMNAATQSLIRRSIRSGVAKSFARPVYLSQHRSFLLGPKSFPPSPAT